MNDDELRQSMATLDAYKVQLEAMAKQSQFFQISLEETLRARDTLNAFANAKEGDEILVPAGASSFVRATITKSRSAVVGIGNKVSIDMDIEDAAKYMATSADEVTAAIKQLSEAIDKMNASAKALATAIQQEYQRRQQ